MVWCADTPEVFRHTIRMLYTAVRAEYEDNRGVSALADLKQMQEMLERELDRIKSRLRFLEAK
jgi:hypothetical protein